RRLDPANRAHRDVMDELNENLADKVFCNFSLFQSMPDVWGIDQIFPVLPLHRLEEKPTRRAVIQDLTCDSDGRIDAYIDRHDIEKTLPLHAPRRGEQYLIGFFLLGAYQEILGDMHNLFGDTHSVNIEMTDSGYRLVQPLEGDDVGDLLRYVHMDPEQLKQAYRRKLTAAGLSPELRRQFENELNSGLTAYTYLEK
ncbi:MAG: arginine decarboxylase, partial [Pseudomonadota bacterium]